MTRSLPASPYECTILRAKTACRRQTKVRDSLALSQFQEKTLEKFRA
jgi:hypothetical protein